MEEPLCLIKKWINSYLMKMGKFVGLKVEMKLQKQRWYFAVQVTV